MDVTITCRCDQCGTLTTKAVDEKKAVYAMGMHQIAVEMVGMHYESKDGGKYMCWKCRDHLIALRSRHQQEIENFFYPNGEE